jgi:hypothetical protein
MFEPKVIASHLDSTRNARQSGQARITLLYEAYARIGRVIYRELTDQQGPSLVPCYACSLSNNDNPALLSFLDLLH